MRWGEKFNDFVFNKAEAEFLEGTTASGKTTVGLFKFMMEVAVSPQKHHILSALDKGTLEKNLIDKDHGIADEWGDVCEYYGNGRGNTTLPHIVFQTPNGEKTIFCLGYDDKTRWKKALGGQYGCLFIDEINVADIEFVREAVMRSDYVLGTLNPDDPALPVYEEFINRCSAENVLIEDALNHIRLYFLIEDVSRMYYHDRALSAESLAACLDDLDLVLLAGSIDQCIEFFYYLNTVV